jgi:hypothetical protein
MKTAVQGDAAAKEFIKAAVAADKAGQSVSGLANRVRADIGGEANALLSSSAVQAEKLRESYNALFNDLDDSRYAQVWREVNELLSQNTASGRALKQLTEHLLQPLIDASTAAAPVVKRFFQGLIIGALQVEIALLDLRIWFRETFGKVELFKGLDWLQIGLTAGKWAVYGLIAVLGLLVAVPAVMIAQFVLVADAFNELYQNVKTGWATLLEVDWGQLGISIIDGIVKPLKAGYAIIGETIAGLGESAIKSFKSALGIASPSKVFTELGVDITRGVTSGVEAGTPSTQRAVDDMVTPPTAASGARAAGGGVTITIGAINITASDSTPAAMASDFKRELEAVLQNIAYQLGANTDGGEVPA